MPSPTTPRAVIDLDVPGPTISRHVYGHFAEHLGRCIYGGLYVGEDSDIPNIHGLRTDVIEALKDLSIPNLRWPGGCFADEYHWRDGIGPKGERPTMVNTNWGDVVEDNSFGTHEFMELCELLGADAYITGNVGSGTVQEMSEWVDYLTRDGDSPMARLRRANGRDEPWKVPFFGVGNENWGCGGHMSPETYAAEARRYATFVRNHDGNRITRIACGPNVDDYRWTEVLMRDLLECDTCPKAEPGPYQAISLHDYTFTGDDFSSKGKALDFTVEDWYTVFRRAWWMDELITRHSTIMDRYDPYRRVGLVVDEWGAWWDVEEGTNPAFLYQQNTVRDALIASLHLDIFHRHAERVIMANLAQTVNVLQSPILTDEATGTMVLTPTYWVLWMSKDHQDAERLDVRWVDETPAHRDGGRPVPLVSVSASRKDGRVLVSLTNLDAEQERTVRLDLRGGEITGSRGTLLTGDALNAHNSVEHPEAVVPAAFDGYSLTDGVLEVTLPRASFATVSLGWAGEPTMSTTAARPSPSTAPGPDEPYGYLMVHFREDAHGYLEKIHLSLSEGDDPLRWEPLGGGEPVLSSPIGTTGVRDPAICQDADGVFHVLATDLRVFGGDEAGWQEWSSHGSRDLLVWDSPDLLSWSGPRAVEVAPPTAGMAWAPEVVVDPATGEHVVFFSSRLFADDDPDHTGPSRTRILYVRTRDFTTFSDAQVMFDNGYDVIDTAVAVIDGLYHRVSKNEEAGVGLGIMHEVGTGLFSDDYRLVASGIASDLYQGVEAPILLQDRRGRTLLFLDQYSVPPQGYFVMQSTDPTSGTWTRVPDDEVRIRPATKHGGILPLTRAQWEALGERRHAGAFS